MTPASVIRHGRRRFVVGLLVLACAPLDAAIPERVLVLQSFGRGFAPFTELSASLRAGLNHASSYPVEIQEISLETALLPTRGTEPSFVRYLNDLEAEWPADLVVAVGAPAVRFVQRNRERLYATTPVLLAGADERFLDPAALREQDGVVPVRVDLHGAFENILRLLPDTNHVVVVMGRSRLEQSWIDELRRELATYSGRLETTFFDDLPFDETLERCAALPAGSAIFFGLLIVDGRGASYADRRALVELHATANAPVFGVFREQLGEGVVGGPLLSAEAVGSKAALAARRMLDGEAPSSVRLDAVTAGAPGYDWREITRWGVDPGRLPPGSTILFREPTLWQAHRSGVLWTVAVAVFQAALILVLVVSLNGRRRAETELRRSRARYAVALEGSNDGVWDWDIRTGDVFLSPRCRDLLGYAADEAVADASTWDDRVAPDDRERVRLAVREHLAGRTTSFREEYRLVLPDGVRRIVLARGRVQRDRDGGASRFAGALTDVTEQRFAEQGLRAVRRELVFAQEEERARLARELHDDITQRLARAAIDAGRVERTGRDPATADTMREVRESLVRLSEDVHALSYRLHPSLLEDLGLPEALQVECDRFTAETSVAVQVRIAGSLGSVARPTAICLFRIAQEALRNVARHAGASRVELDLRDVGGGVQLAVRDDGVGFTAGAKRGRPTVGLASMRERTQLQGGELDIDSVPGEGTTVVAWLPRDGEPS